METNIYGNVDISDLPKGTIHFPGKRLAPLCRKLGIDHAPAFTGEWGGCRKYPKPIINGVVIFEREKDKLSDALLAREKRAKTPEQIAAGRARRQARDLKRFMDGIRMQFPGMPDDDVEACAKHATLIGSGRVGRSNTCEDPIAAAVIAHARHVHTNYDRFRMSFCQEIAREKIREKLTEIIDGWKHPVSPITSEVSYGMEQTEIHV